MGNLLALRENQNSYSNDANTNRDMVPIVKPSFVSGPFTQVSHSKVCHWAFSQVS